MVLRNSPLSCRRASAFRTERKAAKVFPVPVGETINTFRPASISGHAAACAGVGVRYLALNQCVIGDDFILFGQQSASKQNEVKWRGGRAIPRERPSACGI